MEVKYTTNPRVESVTLTRFEAQTILWYLTHWNDVVTGQKCASQLGMVGTELYEGLKAAFNGKWGKP